MDNNAFSYETLQILKKCTNKEIQYLLKAIGRERNSSKMYLELYDHIKQNTAIDTKKKYYLKSFYVGLEVYERYKKICFLSEKIKELQESTPSTATEPISDFSDDTSTKEKLILLDELGVIDFLKSKPPFNTSTNALATALSGVLGIKQSTLQSYLSPMLNTNNEQRNNPRNNHNLVEKAKIKLISIGYKK